MATMSDRGDTPEVSRKAWRIMRALVVDNERKREVCDALGMSFVRVKALWQIVQSPLLMGELAARLGIDAPYATLVVDDLERRGYVERRPDPHDRRAKAVVATRQGRHAAGRATSIMETPPHALAELPEEDLDTLASILASVTDEAPRPQLSKGGGASSSDRSGRRRLPAR